MVHPSEGLIRGDWEKLRFSVLKSPYLRYSARQDRSLRRIGAFRWHRNQWPLMNLNGYGALYCFIRITEAIVQIWMKIDPYYQWQYKVCVDIHRGSLGRGRQTTVGLSKTSIFSTFSRCTFGTFRDLATIRLYVPVLIPLSLTPKEITLIDLGLLSPDIWPNCALYDKSTKFSTDVH